MSKNIREHTLKEQEPLKKLGESIENLTPNKKFILFTFDPNNLLDVDYISNSERVDSILFLEKVLKLFKSHVKEEVK